MNTHRTYDIITWHTPEVPSRINRWSLQCDCSRHRQVPPSSPTLRPLSLSQSVWKWMGFDTPVCFYICSRASDRFNDQSITFFLPSMASPRRTKGVISGTHSRWSKGCIDRARTLTAFWSCRTQALSTYQALPTDSALMIIRQAWPACHTKANLGAMVMNKERNSDSLWGKTNVRCMAVYLH